MKRPKPFIPKGPVSSKPLNVRGRCRVLLKSVFAKGPLVRVTLLVFSPPKRVSVVSSPRFTILLISFDNRCLTSVGHASNDSIIEEVD